ncbi:hypothetical protein [uncultured Winogradskyella sp.]|uniref:hypothetical protein n=1 Tax=uncultured Winogradskyella sp. TaxID=395353 RepID=UPI00263347CA|nr:hypothetical protein [uncultured Winogradskyella sp.]
MESQKETNRLLQKMVELLAKNEARIETNELTSTADGLIKKAEKEGDEAAKKIQSSFDRIHDKLFTINSILIASYVGLSKFPTEKPIFSLWMALLPILNIFYLVLLEKYQMEIYRHASQRMNWNLSTDVDKYGKKINRQNLRSLLAIITTLALSIFLAVKIITY